MDRIRAQASKLWELIFASETAAAYQRALALTWEILRETAQLIWLLFCLVFVLVAWIGEYAKKLGQNFRNWYERLGEKPAETEEVKPFFSSAGQSILEASSSSASFLLAQASEQLGIEYRPPKPNLPVSQPQASGPPSPDPAPAGVSQVSGTVKKSPPPADTSIDKV
ncbi:MAG: hypothetical protein HC886_17210 [Leptolyngbyaceae cyanobacterium SM1_1_3]|nr:hypothetical protein [Leptolyngbyaceae cyanobacterium SM1_1_3]NJN01085.1 hypothetical protein [Leptolyngbyaceae cyanobacterium RM1_1_2]NJO11550.1 hypothetical protein [Leptolyngbyaceae cyanobacterium SL_1_1]